MTILQSNKVWDLINKYSLRIPEAPLIFYEEPPNRLHVLIPHDFDSLPGLTRLYAFNEINNLMDGLVALGIVPVAGISKQGVIK